MSERLRIEKPLIGRRASLRWKVLDQAQVLISPNPAHSPGAL